MAKQPRLRSDEENGVVFRALMGIQQLMSIVPDSKVIDTLSKNVQLFNMERGATAYVEGSTPNGMFIVHKGRMDSIARLFVLANEGYFDLEGDESGVLYPKLRKELEVDESHDMLRRIRSYGPGDVFGDGAYLMETSREESVVAAVDSQVIFIPHTYAADYLIPCISAQYKEKIKSIENAIPHIAPDQVSKLAAFASIRTMHKGYEISDRSEVYILRDGVVARFKSVDFSMINFRRQPAPFESLEIRYPDKPTLVHTDDIKTGELFTASSNELVTQRVKEESSVVVITGEFLKIIVGNVMYDSIMDRAEFKTPDSELIQIWTENRKKKNWEEFKKRVVKESHKRLKVEAEARAGTYAIRRPSNPKALGFYKPRK